MYRNSHVLPCTGKTEHGHLEDNSGTAYDIWVEPFDPVKTPQRFLLFPFRDGGNDPFDLEVRDSHRTGKTETLAMDPLGHRTFRRVGSSVGGGEVQGLPERPGLDPSPVQAAKEGAAARPGPFFVHEDSVQPKRTECALRLLRASDTEDFGESPRIGPGRRALVGHMVFQSLHLSYTDGGQHIGR